MFKYFEHLICTIKNILLYIELTYLFNFTFYKKITLSTDQDISIVSNYLKHNSNPKLLNKINNFFLTIDNKKNSYLAPAYGIFKWSYEGEEYIFKLYEEGYPRTCFQDIRYFTRLEIYNKDITKLENFVKTIFLYKPEDEQFLNVYYNHQGYWNPISNIYGQNLENVYLPENIKNNISKEIDTFINSKKNYIKHGVPYKKCFLFSGIPGSGKTSLIKALSKKYKYSIYFLNIDKMNDGDLINLITSIKENSFLIIEDIDNLFTTNNENKLNVTYSGFINIMDGIVSNMNGIITFLTANNPERIDKSLIRSGRIDSIYNFEYAKEPEIRLAFNRLIENDDDDVFVNFYVIIKKLKLSMSDIVGFLFKYKDNYMDKVEILKTEYSLRQEYIGTEKINRLYT